MKTLVTILAVVLMVSSMVSAADVANWNSFVIRNATSGGAAPAINDTTTTKEFVINAGGMKAAWGTDNISGAKVGQITELTIDRLDNWSRFSATTAAGARVAPYFNIWITDGSGNYAVIANEPSNGEWRADTNNDGVDDCLQWNITSWNMLSGKTAKVYEAKGPAGANWVYTLIGKSSNLTFNDFANLTIGAPDQAFIAANYTGAAGTPRELGTNNAYAFNWIFGDTLANYVSDPTGYIVANPTAVPEPATMCLLGLGGLLFARKKK